MSEDPREVTYIGGPYLDSDGKWTLTLRLEKQTTVKTLTIVWPKVPSEEEVAQAVQLLHEDEPLGVREDGQAMQVRRKVLPYGLGTLIFSHFYGPPVWRLPKFRREFSRNKIDLGVGWWLHAFQIAWLRGPDYE